eukprot:4520815-Amphidinium_carterae.3
MTVERGRVSWDALQVRSRSLSDMMREQDWNGEVEVTSLLQQTHDMGAKGLWLYKQLSLRVAESLDRVLAEGPAQGVEQPLAQGKRRRQRCIAC